ncbi:unnamed protein product, partial [Iphiclides podalirius]
MIIVYIDIVLLIILLFLILFTCGYCVYRVHRLQQNGQVAILLKPTRVLFSHRKEGDSNEELRTVVAYQNPFTGDYCVHKSRLGTKCYVNAAPALPSPPSPLPHYTPASPASPASPDSGMSDEYEPLAPVPRPDSAQDYQEPLKPPLIPAASDNSVNKTWNWNYTEYQI